MQRSRGTISNAVYWSHPGSRSDAQKLAKRLNGHYIYDYVSNEDIAKWSNLCSADERKVLWARASYAFAKLSSGTTYVVTTTANSDSIWINYEFRVLKGTGLINSVVSIDDPTHPRPMVRQIFSKSLLDKLSLPAEP